MENSSRTRRDGAARVVAALVAAAAACLAGCGGGTTGRPDADAPLETDSDGGGADEGGAEADAGDDSDAGLGDSDADGGGDSGPDAVLGPRDLFAGPNSIETLQGLTLEELCWVQTGEEVDPATGVTETVGSWCGGTFETFDSTGTPRSIDLAERAAIYWPPGYPDTEGGRAGLGHVHAAHEAASVRSGNGALLADGFGLPVLQHGDNTDYLGLLGIPGRGEMTDATGPNLIRVNPCEVVDLTRGNFGWALARTNIRAITLLARLAEARGGSVARVALRGGSKEGFATWLASAVDDRIEVDSSGGYQREDPRASLPFYAADWGCTPPPAASDYDIREMQTFSDWLLNSPAGQAAERSLSVALFGADLYPRFILVNGDVTRFGMHDSHHYPLGCETPFLDAFSAVPWRYDRRPNDRETGEVKEGGLRAVLLEQLVEGPGHLDLVYPRVTAASAEESGRRFRVTASVAAAAPEAVRMWWSHSDDRAWNDEENADWADVPMTAGAGADWVSDWVDAPAGDEVAWFVEAETTLSIGGYDIARRDASPVRFLWLLPEVGCPADPVDWCTP